MSLINSAEGLQQLLTRLANDDVPDSGRRFERALNENRAVTNLNQDLTRTLTFQKELAEQLAREEAELAFERRKAAEEESARQAKAVQGLLAGAEAEFLPTASDEDREALRGSELDLLFRGYSLEQRGAELAAGDPFDPVVQQNLSDLRAARAQVDVQAAAQGFDAQSLGEYEQAIGAREAFRNQGQSALNPISFLRNAAGGAVRGAAGLADLGLSLVGAGGPVAGAGEALGEFVDDTSLGTTIQQAQLAGRDPDGFVEGAQDFLSTLNPGAAADQLANIAGLIGTGGGVNLAARAGANAARRLTGREAVDQAADGSLGALLRQGGTGSLLAGAGQEFAGAAADDTGGERAARALAQLTGTSALGALAGTRLGGSVLGGIEGAVARGGIPGALGGTLRSADDAITASGFRARATQDLLDRARTGAAGALRQAPSEAAQETVEQLISQGAGTLATGENEFNTAELGGAAAAGAIFGGGLGTGGAARFRPSSVPAAESAPVQAAPVGQPLPTGTQLGLDLGTPTQPAQPAPVQPVNPGPVQPVPTARFGTPPVQRTLDLGADPRTFSPVAQPAEQAAQQAAAFQQVAQSGTTPIAVQGVPQAARGTALVAAPTAAPAFVPQAASVAPAAPVAGVLGGPNTPLRQVAAGAQQPRGVPAQRFGNFTGVETQLPLDLGSPVQPPQQLGLEFPVDAPAVVPTPIGTAAPGQTSLPLEAPGDQLLLDVGTPQGLGDVRQQIQALDQQPDLQGIQPDDAFLEEALQTEQPSPEELRTTRPEVLNNLEQRMRFELRNGNLLDGVRAAETLFAQGAMTRRELELAGTSDITSPDQRQAFQADVASFAISEAEIGARLRAASESAPAAPATGLPGTDNVAAVDAPAPTVEGIATPESVTGTPAVAAPAIAAQEDTQVEAPLIDAIRQDDSVEIGTVARQLITAGSRSPAEVIETIDNQYGGAPRTGRHRTVVNNLRSWLRRNGIPADAPRSSAPPTEGTPSGEQRPAGLNAELVAEPAAASAPLPSPSETVPEGVSTPVPEQAAPAAESAIEQDPPVQRPADPAQPTTTQAAAEPRATNAEVPTGAEPVIADPQTGLVEPNRGGRTRERRRARQVSESTMTNPRIKTARSIPPLPLTSGVDAGAAPALSQVLTPTQLVARAKKYAPAFNFQVVNERDITEEFNDELVADTGSGFDSSVIALLRGDTIYLNAGRVSTPEDVDFVMAHEILGHAGLRERYGPKLRPLLREVVDSFGGLEGMLARADELGLALRTNYSGLVNRARQSVGYTSDHETLAEELLVNLVDVQGVDAPRAGLLQRMGAEVRSWLRRSFPRLAKVLNSDVYADWELAVLAGEASYAGRQLLDGAQPVGRPRILAARRAPFAERMRDIGKDYREEAQRLHRNLTAGDAPASARLKGTTENIRGFLRDAGRNENNFYNRHVKGLVNHRRPLQLLTRQIRDRLASNEQLNNVAQSILNGYENASKKDRVKLKGDEGSTETSNQETIMRGFFDTLLNGATGQQAAEILRDMTALYERMRLGENDAQRQFEEGIQVFAGQLDEGFALLSGAMEGRQSKRNVYEFADAYRRYKHGVERNDAFLYDFTKDAGKDKKLKLRTHLSKDVMKELKALRKRVRSTGNDVLTPRAAFTAEKRLIDQHLPPEARAEMVEQIATTGPESTTPELLRKLSEMEVTASEQVALDSVTDTLAQMLELDTEVLDTWNGGSRNFDDAVERFDFKFYSPQWVEDSEKANDYEIGSGVSDPMMTSFEAAQGTIRQTTSPIASIITKLNRTYHDRHDNEISKDVITLWAAAQTAEGTAALGRDFGSGVLTLVEKTSQDYETLKAKVHPNKFVHHLQGDSTGLSDLIASGARGDFNEQLRSDPSNYVAVLTYDAKSDIPELVKGKRERSEFVQRLRQSDNLAAQIVSNGARTIGSFHTKYDPAFPVINFVRETIASFAVVSAREGWQAGATFGKESMGAALRIAPKMAQYLYWQSETGAKAAKRLSELQADPEMQDFLQFFETGAPVQFARSMSLNSRVEDFIATMRSKGLTPDELDNLGRIDKLIQVAPTMTDLISRYAAYRTFMRAGNSSQEAAFQALSIADFGQTGGSRAADLGALSYMFFRSAVVGATQIVDSLLDSQYNLEAAGVAGGAATALFAMAWAMAGEDDDGNNKFLTQGSSTTHFKFFIGDEIHQIPYSYNGFTAIGAATVQSLFGLTGNQSFVESAGNIVDIAINNVTPVSNNIPLTDDLGNLSFARVGQKLTDLASPSLISPLVALGMNTDNFGNEITQEPGSLGSPGYYGRPYNSSGRQIGTASEAIARFLAENTGLSPDVRTIHFLTNEMINGPAALADTALEWGRVLSGREYDTNWKRAALPFAGLIGAPYNQRREQYYQLWGQQSSIESSIRTLERSGLSEGEARARVSDAIGAEGLAGLDLFKDLNGDVLSTATEMKNIRLNQVMTSAERATRYKALQEQHDSQVATLVKRIEELTE